MLLKCQKPKLSDCSRTALTSKPSAAAQENEILTEQEELISLEQVLRRQIATEKEEIERLRAEIADIQRWGRTTFCRSSHGIAPGVLTCNSAPRPPAGSRAAARQRSIHPTARARARTRRSSRWFSKTFRSRTRNWRWENLASSRLWLTL